MRYSILKDGERVDSVDDWSDAVEIAESYAPTTIQDLGHSKILGQRARTWIVVEEGTEPVYMGGQAVL